MATLGHVRGRGPLDKVICGANDAVDSGRDGGAKLRKVFGVDSTSLGFNIKYHYVAMTHYLGLNIFISQCHKYLGLNNSM